MLRARFGVADVTGMRSLFNSRYSTNSRDSRCVHVRTLHTRGIMKHSCPATTISSRDHRHTRARARARDTCVRDTCAYLSRPLNSPIYFDCGLPVTHRNFISSLAIIRTITRSRTTTINAPRGGFRQRKERDRERGERTASRLQAERETA